MSEKIIITGTGRAGTSFLVVILTLLKLDTGFKIDDIDTYSLPNAAGMESTIYRNHQILKNPKFIADIEQIIEMPNLLLKYVIIPIREYEESAHSRFNNSQKHILEGSLWLADNVESQQAFYHKIMANYVKVMVQYDIPTIFIDFKRMTTDIQYLYNKLQPILPTTLGIKQFEIAYTQATIIAKRKIFYTHVDNSSSNMERILTPYTKFK